MSGGMSVETPLSLRGVACAAGGGTGPESATARNGSAPVRVPVPPSQGQDTPMARAWSLRSFLELGAYPSAVPCSRLHTRAVLWEWGLGRDEGAELVVDEIVTNAVQASRSLSLPVAVRLWLFSDRERLLIMVWDASPNPPVRPDPEAEEISESGRGLMLVEAISERWSWYVTKLPWGKVVWALCTNAGERRHDADG